ncbi:MAG: helix-turn-helix transcriptional regulator [bacterium]
MIKNKLRIILAERDISIKKLAEITDIRYATLYAFVKGKTNSADFTMLNKICKFLNITPGDILEYIPEEEQKE